MDKDQLDYAESSQRQHYDTLQHQEKMMYINEQLDFSKFALLKPKLTKDGDQWCVLYGEDLQSGIAGFGDTPYKAVLDWNAQWHQPANSFRNRDKTEKA